MLFTLPGEDVSIFALFYADKSFLLLLLSLNILRTTMRLVVLFCGFFGAAASFDVLSTSSLSTFTNEQKESELSDALVAVSSHRVSFPPPLHRESAPPIRDGAVEPIRDGAVEEVSGTFNVEVDVPVAPAHRPRTLSKCEETIGNMKIDDPR